MHKGYTTLFTVLFVFLTFLSVGVSAQQNYTEKIVKKNPQKLSVFSKKDIANKGTQSIGGNYLPQKLNRDEVSTESIIVRPREAYRRDVIEKAYAGKEFANSKALYKRALAKSFNLRQAREIRKNLYVVSGANVNPSKVNAAYKTYGYKLIEPNYKVKAQIWEDMDINDPYAESQWSLASDPGIGMDCGVWGFEEEITDDVIVGVIDTGVNCKHRDLQGVCWENESEIANDFIDNDNNGYVDDFSGYNFAYGNGDSNDDHGHGTHVAGIIAAKRNNGFGIIGATSVAKILPLKSLDSEGEGYLSDIISAIEYAIQFRNAGNNLRVVNMSLGSSYESIEGYNVIKDANEVGITVVAAAGNEYGTEDSYPASYDLPNVISVAAHDKFGNLANFSNYGPLVHVSAPGVDILSLDYSTPSGLISFDGTSMAAPHVAGMVALISGYFPEHKPSDYKNSIINGAIFDAEYSDNKKFIPVVAGTSASISGVFTKEFDLQASSNTDVKLYGYVVDSYKNKKRPISEVKLFLSIKENGSYVQKGVAVTDSNGRYEFSHQIPGAEYLIQTEDEEVGSISGIVPDQDSLLPYFTYTNQIVKVQVHVIDRDLKPITDMGGTIDLKYVLKSGRQINFQYVYFDLNQEMVVDCVLGTGVRISMQKDQMLADEYDTVDMESFYPVELDNVSEERDVVILSKPTEAVTNTTTLPAPFISHVGGNDIEVVMKPFTGVDFKGKKGLSVRYRVSLTNTKTKQTVEKRSYLSRVVFNDLEKGIYKVKYYTDFMDSKGNRIAGTLHWSPQKEVYVGYPKDVLTPDIHPYAMAWNWAEFKYTPSFSRQGDTSAVITFPVEKAVYNGKEVDLFYNLVLTRVIDKKVHKYTVNPAELDIVSDKRRLFLDGLEPHAYDVQYSFTMKDKSTGKVVYKSPLSTLGLQMSLGEYPPLEFQQDTTIGGLIPACEIVSYNGVARPGKISFKKINIGTGEEEILIFENTVEDFRNMIFSLEPGEYTLQDKCISYDDNGDILDLAEWSKKGYWSIK